MLISVDDLTTYDVIAADGEIGSVIGLYLDSSSKIQYLILDTGTWLSGRKVIIPAEAITRSDRQEKKIEVHYNRERIENSPEVNEYAPLTLEVQTRIDDYYALRALSPVSAPVLSTSAVVGSYIQAKDGDIGHVEDFIIDDAEWVVRYMVVDTANWWPGKMVLISPLWVQSMMLPDNKIYIDLTREQIKRAPEYTQGEMPAREYEEKLYGHYRRPGYWAGEDVTEKRPVV